MAEHGKKCKFFSNYKLKFSVGNIYIYVCVCVCVCVFVGGWVGVWGQEGSLVQIDFSAAFDMINYQGIFFKFCSAGVGGFVLSVLTCVSLYSVTVYHGGRLSEQTG